MDDVDALNQTMNEERFQPQVTMEQPEAEMTPVTSLGQHQDAGTTSQDTALTQAMRRNLDALDGHPAPRQRTTDPLASVVEGQQFSKVHRWHAFVAGRTEKKYKKKVAKTGAGRELHYDKEDTSV